MKSNVLIEIRGLVKTFDIRPVLRKLDLEVQRGEFVALLGPNGSGKSTLLRLLAGLSKPTAGRIAVGGWELPKEAAAVRAQIGVVSHKSLLYDNLSARENLLFYAALYNLTPEQAGERADYLLRQVNLIKRSHSLVREFSRGMQQRLSIARALLHDPDVLLLDEPYTGLDQDASATLDGLLRDAFGKERTIIMTTHALEHAAGLAQRAVILSRGVIAYDAPMAELRESGITTTYAAVTGTTASAGAAVSE